MYPVLIPKKKRAVQTHSTFGPRGDSILRGRGLLKVEGKRATIESKPAFTTASTIIEENVLGSTKCTLCFQRTRATELHG